MKDNRGGTRPHSGKKTELYGQPTRRVQVTLDERTLELLAVLGGTETSAKGFVWPRGLRTARHDR